MSVNKVILIGRLGQNPEVRYTPSGAAVANFSVATNETWNDKSGQKQERTEWHKVVVWGKLAELCGQYLAKGRQVYLEGRLQTREWMDKDNQKKYTTEVQAQSVQFLGGQNEKGAPMGMGAGSGRDADMGMSGGGMGMDNHGGGGYGGGHNAMAGASSGGPMPVGMGGGMPRSNGPAEPSFTEDDIPF